MLRHRNVEIVNLDVILPTRHLSVYDFAVPPVGLIPTEAEISECLDAVELEHADPATLEREIARLVEGITPLTLALSPEGRGNFDSLSPLGERAG